MREGRVPRTLKGLALLLILGFVVPSGFGRTVTGQLTDAAGEVIIQAVKFGLDVAGEKVLGPTGWRGFKQVLEPVIRRLQARYPSLTFGNPADKAAERAAQEAAQYLRTSKELQDILLTNFNQLHEGQKEILDGISRLERMTQAMSMDVRDTRTMVEELLRGRRVDQGEALSPEPPTVVDVSDMMNDIEFFLRRRARLDGHALSETVVKLIIYGVGLFTFQQRVLEGGRPFRIYTSTIGGMVDVCTMRASGSYQDQDRLLCKRLTSDCPVIGKPGRRVISTAAVCRIEGTWQETRQIERREY